MKNLSLIAVVGKNRELGQNNELIWYLPEDLRFFKKQTINKTIIMGRNTFESLPSLLPNRKHIVLSSKDIYVPSEVIVCHNYNELLNIMNSNDEYYVIGGGMIYSLLLPEVECMYLTEVDMVYKQANVYFPQFNYDDWNKEVISCHEYNGINYSHVKYLRKVK